MDDPAAVLKLRRSVTILAENNMRCSELRHLALDEIPFSDIAQKETQFICGVSTVQLLAWHRDLAYFLVIPDGGCDEPVLVKACTVLGKHLDEVPRDTVYMYAARANYINPRTFSQTSDEVTFVHALQKACEILLTANLKAMDFVAGILSEADCVDGLVACLNELTKRLVTVIREVGVDVFVLQIEPNFRRITLNGQKFYGPTASQLPLVSLEAVLYGINAGENLKRHIAFQRNYLPPSLRAVVDHFSVRPGILTGRISPAGCLAINRAIQRFRKIHMALARRAFAKQKIPSLHAKELLEGLISEAELRLTEN